MEKLQYLRNQTGMFGSFTLTLFVFMIMSPWCSPSLVAMGFQCRPSSITTINNYDRNNCILKSPLQTRTDSLYPHTTSFPIKRGSLLLHAKAPSLAEKGSYSNKSPGKAINIQKGSSKKQLAVLKRKLGQLEKKIQSPTKNDKKPVAPPTFEFSDAMAKMTKLKQRLQMKEREMLQRRQQEQRKVTTVLKQKVQRAMKHQQTLELKKSNLIQNSLERLKRDLQKVVQQQRRKQQQ